MFLVDYVTVDVFTENRFSGNPLAVIPQASGLTRTDMLNIASEFKYSETAFVFPPEDPANDAKVRIFTPTNEVPFAGHPSVGTAFALSEIGSLKVNETHSTLRFEEEAGLVEAQVIFKEGEITGAEVRVPQRLALGPRVSSETVANCVGIPRQVIKANIHPPIVASVGLPFVIAELESIAALSSARPNPFHFSNAAGEYPILKGRFPLYLYVRLDRSGQQLRARMFAPLSNILEDPATGSAASALASFLVDLIPEWDVSTDVMIMQGVECRKRSVIRVAVTKEAGKVGQPWLSGNCKLVMRGQIRL